MKKNKVSVVVPFYNAKDTLHRCLSSISNQTFKNLEIILIDDGSTDLSKSIYKNFKNEDKRLKVLINKRNEGASSSRNKAISYY
jgi:glycosyltransferase involved in cell wall biosynthesis